MINIHFPPLQKKNMYMRYKRGQKEYLGRVVHTGDSKNKKATFQKSPKGKPRKRLTTNEANDILYLNTQYSFKYTPGHFLLIYLLQNVTT